VVATVDGGGIDAALIVQKLRWSKDPFLGAGRMSHLEPAVRKNLTGRVRFGAKPPLYALTRWAVVRTMESEPHLTRGLE